MLWDGWVWWACYACCFFGSVVFFYLLASVFNKIHRFVRAYPIAFTILTPLMYELLSIEQLEIMLSSPLSSCFTVL